MHVVFSESWNYFLSLFTHFELRHFCVLILQKSIGSRYLVPLTPPTVFGQSFWNFTWAFRMAWRYACGFFQNPEIIFYHFFCIFNLDIFWVLILQKCIGSRYLVPLTPPTVFGRSFWNFTWASRMAWRYACVFFRILKLIFITGFLLQYLGKWYRTNGPLVNLLIFNSSNKNKAGDINSLWNSLVTNVLTLGYCQNFVTAQYLIKEFMDFDQILHMNWPQSDLDWDCYTSIFANLQQSYGPWYC